MRERSPELDLVALPGSLTYAHASVDRPVRVLADWIRVVLKKLNILLNAGVGS